MESCKWTIGIASVLLTVLLPGPAAAQTGNFDFGIRFDGLGGNGEPTNDILGYGANVRYRLNDRWWLGFGVDLAEGFDFEAPSGLLGLRSVEVTDSKGNSTLVSSWIERVYEHRRIEWFWAGGVGLNFLDFDPAVGDLAGGGDYRIVTTADDELVASASGGLRWKLGSHWSFEAAIRADQHFADWKVLDEVSGLTATVDDYFIRGVTVGARYRF